MHVGEENKPKKWLARWCLCDCAGLFPPQELYKEHFDQLKPFPFPNSMFSGLSGGDNFKYCDVAPNFVSTYLYQ